MIIMRKTFDYSLLKTRTFDKEIYDDIKLIHEFKSKQDLYLEQSSQELNKFIDRAEILSTEVSNAIEGITITEKRFVEIMYMEVNPETLNEEEIKGYKETLDLVNTSFKYIQLSSYNILQLHKIMFEYTDLNFGGKFKDTPNQISVVSPDGHKSVIFKPLEPYETPEAIESICNEYNKSINQYNVDPLIAIPVFVHDFLFIHLFNDGNERMPRLLTELLLLRSGYLVGKYIPLEKKIQISGDDYYNALKQSQSGWIENRNDNTPFIKYMLSINFSL